MSPCPVCSDLIHQGKKSVIYALSNLALDQSLYFYFKFRNKRNKIEINILLCLLPLVDYECIVIKIEFDFLNSEKRLLYKNLLDL